MNNFEKAKDLYLRGFCGEYIKRRTGISVQSLLKKLLSVGICYTKDDIVEYQIAYIQGKYSLEDVEQAYRNMSRKYPILEKAARHKHIECLGCGFGQYPKVFSEILGSDRYKILKNECWSKKQSAAMERLYGVSNAFDKRSGMLENNPMHSEAAKEKRRQTMLVRYGVEHPNQNPVIKNKMMQSQRNTNLRLYGVGNPMQCKDVAIRSAEHRQLTMLEKYGACNSVQIESIRNAIFETRKKNGTLNSSTAEDVLYEMLIAYFGKNDVLRNVCVDSRYPYHVDFYIKSRDLFIELNGDKCHYDHWFCSDDDRDLQVLHSWIENRDRIELETGKKSRYRKYIDTWTVSDVKKRESAKAHHLNYLVFWDGSRKIRKNNKLFPRLKDANEWFDAGCPDSKDWRQSNTY